MSTRSFRSVLTIAAALVAVARIASAAGTPEQQCEAAKNKAAGSYAVCRQKAEAALATSGDVAKYGGTLAKCDAKLASAWQKAIDKTANAGAACLDAGLTVDDFQSAIDACTGDLATALAGGGLSSCAADLATVNTGTASAADVRAGKTFASNGGLQLTGTMPDNGAVSITPSATPQTIAAGYHDGGGTVEGDADLVPGNITAGVNVFGVTGTAPAARVLRTGQTVSWGATSDGVQRLGLAPSYTDNGDGTITDNTTGLMWEKKSDDGSVHDKDNNYNWSTVETTGSVQMDGTLVTSFLATLNAGSGFAGYTDWRIPNANEMHSLATFVTGTRAPELTTPCSAGCTVTTCSCSAGQYWSSTAHGDQYKAMAVDLLQGTISGVLKAERYWARAVRGGL